MIYTIMILLGAIIFTLSFPSYIKIIRNYEKEKNQKYWIRGLIPLFMLIAISQDKKAGTKKDLTCI